MLYIGIDAGLTGAICFLRGEEVVELHDMPTEQSKSTGGTVKRMIDPAVLSDIMRLHPDMPKSAALEWVQSMPTQGVASMMSLGDSFGCARSAVCGNGIPIVYVRPQKWKKHFDLIGADKGESISIAKQLYPNAKLTHKKHHGRADAILIARWLQDGGA